MNSLTHMYAMMKRQQEQKRVISGDKPKHRVLSGGCVLYQLPRAKASNQGVVQA
jgi:hypothetical protein